MDKKRIFLLGIVIIVGLMLTGCAWHYGDNPPSSYNLGLGVAYYGYPDYQGDGGPGQYPVVDEHRHHHRH